MSYFTSLSFIFEGFKCVTYARNSLFVRCETNLVKVFSYLHFNTLLKVLIWVVYYNLLCIHNIHVFIQQAGDGLYFTQPLGAEVVSVLK